MNFLKVSAMFRTLSAVVLALYLPLSGVLVVSGADPVVAQPNLPETSAVSPSVNSGAEPAEASAEPADELALLILKQVQGTEGLVNEIEVTKEAALYIEDFLEMVKGRVEDSFIRGDITKEQWEEYQFQHEDTMHFHHLLVMATLFYEEAADDTHGVLLATFARDLAERVLRIEWFCQNNGIEIVPYGELII